MKKLVSAVLAFVMLTSMFTTASAATMSEMLTRYSVPETFDMGTLAVKVSAKKTGDQAYSADGLKLLTAKESGVAAGVDYLAELDMEPVRSLFNKPIISLVLGDAQAEAEFYSGTVNTNVAVTITYPAQAVAEQSSLETAGSINNPAFYEAGARVFGTNAQGDKTVTITYNNINNLTVADLVSENSTVLNDIAFTLDSAIKYNTDGYHKVTVSMEGSTTVTFAGGVHRVVEFEGGSSHIVSAAVDHVLRVIPAVPATCTTPGTTEGVICQSHIGYDCPSHGFEHNGYDCGINGTYEPQSIATLKHKNSDGSFATVVVAGIAPTCTAKGLTAHWVCTLCKGDFNTAEPGPTAVGSPAASFDIPANGHANVPFVGRAATCTMDGYNSGTECSVCGHKTGGGIIPATGHSIVIDSAIAATCTVAGKTEGKHCENCSYEIPQVDIAALGHNFGPWNEVTAATESSTGLLERTCQRGCGTTETQIIPQLEPSHTCAVNEELAVITPATCETPGSKQNYCECGQPVDDPIVIPATGHNLTEVPKSEGTCTVKGTVKHYKCSTCGNRYRNANGKGDATHIETSYNKKNHVDENGVESKIRIEPTEKTCETDGWSEGWMCAYCNTVITKQDRISKSHDFEPIAAKAATCETAGVIAHYHCKVCNKDFANNKKTELSTADYTIAPLGHKWGNVSVTQAPTEELEGQGVKVCTRDSSHRENVTIARLEHVHNETVYKHVKDKTCTEPGLKVKVYTCCNEEYTGNDKEAPIPASHVLVNQSLVAPTCRKEGIAAHTYCAVCQKRFTDATATTEITETTVGKLAHSMQLISDTVVGDVTERVEECEHCHETMRTKSHTPKAIIDHNDHQAEKIKGDREDAMTEKDHAEAAASSQVLKAESQLEVEETGLSEELDSKIQNKDQAVDEKVVLEIVATAVNKFVDEATQTIVYDQKKEIITETDDYFTVTINIPESMRGKTDYRVYRIHDGAHTANDIITEIENSFGEKIVSIDHVGHTLKIRVKRFSEYVLVAYNEQQPEVDYSEPTQPTGPVGGGGGIPTYTVKFNTNGGIIVDSAKVMRGKVLEAPVTSRDGYVFDGWYEDSALTIPFDFNTPITKSFTLYAKWIKVEECRGIEEDNCPCLDFTDLDPTMWYHKGVDFVLNNGMMVGVAESVFAPDLDVTRAMLVTVLWRKEGKPAGSMSTFADLEEGLYYVDAVEWAAENGVVTGYSDKVFAPNDSITREQFAAIMYRYAKNKGYDVSVGENTNILSYTDADQISEYAIAAIQYAVGSGLMTGRTESTINPKDNTTRAEMATILYRFYTENK